MVNIGKPSHACESCRKRRIKCDQLVPQCSQCVRKDWACPGYRHRFDIAWRDQNTVAERSVQRRKRATEKTDRAAVPTGYMRGRVPIPIREYQEDHALCFFFTTFVLVPRELETSRGYLEHMAPIYIKLQAESPAIFATSAVAIALLEAWTRKGAESPWTRASFVKAISAVRKKVEQEQEYSVEELLLAILLLDFYQGLGSVVRPRPPNGIHIKGALALVKHCNAGSFKSEASQRFLMALRNRTIEYALQTHEPVPEDISNWSEIVQDLPPSAALRLDSINIHVANVQAMASKCLHPGPIGHPNYRSDVKAILKLAHETDNSLAAWPETLPSSFAIQKISGPDQIPAAVRSAGLYQEHCDNYSSIFTAGVWNSYRTSRIKIQIIILRCFAVLHPLQDRPPQDTNTNSNTLSVMDIHHDAGGELTHPGLPEEPTGRPSGNPRESKIEITEAVDFASATVQSLTDDICASIPFYLGDRTESGWLYDDEKSTFPSLYHPSHQQHSHTMTNPFSSLSSSYSHEFPTLQSQPSTPTSSPTSNPGLVPTPTQTQFQILFQNSSPPTSATQLYTHQRTATAIGCWSLFSALHSCTAPEMPLRKGQRGWIEDQLGRLLTFYRIKR